MVRKDGEVCRLGADRAVLIQREPDRLEALLASTLADELDVLALGQRTVASERANALVHLAEEYVLAGHVVRVSGHGMGISPEPSGRDPGTPSDYSGFYHTPRAEDSLSGFSP